MYDVSVLICTYNREDMLVNTIKDVLAQSYESFEVIVVDQTVQHLPETQSYIDSISNVVKFVKQSPSLTKARNRALKEARGKILIFIDDDVRLNKDFIQEHVNAHRAGFSVVQGRIVEAKDSNKKASPTPQNMDWKIKIRGRNDCLHMGGTNTLTGCNFSIERDVVERVGLFDEFFQNLAIREDADYGIRCHRAGEKMIFWPKAELEHLRSNVGGVDTGIS
uniref:glycosyltransferase family 2 protein n=1 Tax=Aeromonas caviae TaxID=648 RepID=UPI0025B6A993